MKLSHLVIAALAIPLAIALFRLIARLRFGVIDILIVGTVAGLAWLATRRKASQPEAQTSTNTPDNTAELRSQLSTLSGRIENVTNYISELESVAKDTSQRAHREAREAVREVLDENKNRYETLLTSQREYRDALQQLQSMIEERRDVYIEKLRLLKIAQRGNETRREEPETADQGVDVKKKSTELAHLDAENAELIRALETLTDDAETIVNIKELLSQYGISASDS